MENIYFQIRNITANLKDYLNYLKKINKKKSKNKQKNSKQKNKNRNVFKQFYLGDFIFTSLYFKWVVHSVSSPGGMQLFQEMLQP